MTNKYMFFNEQPFENGNVKKESFLLDIGKGENKKIEIEQADFGQIYQFIFTDKDFYDDVKTLINKEKMNKSDYIKKIQSLDENTMWQKCVGKNYNDIEDNFLAIKNYRNHVMHNHLINYDTFKEAKRVINIAINTLDRAIKDKLIVNSSQYLNNISIIKHLNDMYPSFLCIGSSCVSGIASCCGSSNISGITSCNVSSSVS